MLINYSGGIYKGSVRTRKCKAKHCSVSVPHGWGQLVYKNDVRYIGYFRNGFEHGQGRLIWANGDVYDCYFKHGRPEAGSLKFVHAKAKAQIRELKSSLIECQEDLDLEKEKSMQLALSLDRAQDRSQAMYALALSAGVDAGTLNAIRDSL